MWNQNSFYDPDAKCDLADTNTVFLADTFCGSMVNTIALNPNMAVKLVMETAQLGKKLSNMGNFFSYTFIRWFFHTHPYGGVSLNISRCVIRVRAHCGWTKEETEKNMITTHRFMGKKVPPSGVWWEQMGAEL